ncbi:hypothetical protein ACFFX1_10760 [Dactylosporangium sucinum]|nr:hypothetical protein [Dactylosporangium sucinum]
MDDQQYRSSSGIRRALLTAAIACAVLAAAALMVSWTTTGSARLAGGIGSAVFGAVAVFLAGLWYLRNRAAALRR